MSLLCICLCCLHDLVCWMLAYRWLGFVWALDQSVSWLLVFTFCFGQDLACLLSVAVAVFCQLVLALPVLPAQFTGLSVCYVLPDLCFTLDVLCLRLPVVSGLRLCVCVPAQAWLWCQAGW